MTPDPPNIVMLISDNQRLDTLGFLSETQCQTPTWDRVAREGMHFLNYRSASPLCSPTRASMFTGFQPHQASMPHLPFSDRIFVGEEDRAAGYVVKEISKPPISHYLRSSGYECLYAGKWHLGKDNITEWFDRTVACDQEDRDYSQWCKEQGIPDGRIFHDPVRSKKFRSKHYPGMSLPRPAMLDIPEDKEYNKWVLNNALEIFDLRKRDKPFFMVLSVEGPHPPLQVPRRYYDMYDPERIPEPPNWHPTPGEPSFLPSSYYRKLRNEWGDDFSAWRKSIAVYWGFTTYIDSLFGAFLDHLKQEGALENTLVVMLSDHGEMMGQHGLWQKFCPYEEAIRVPWVMSWPGVIEPGSRCAMDVSAVDVAATLIAAGGVDVDNLGLEGDNLFPCLTGEREPSETRDCFCQYNVAPDFAPWHGVQDWRMILRRPWKYALHTNGEEELYYLAEDPSELDNCAGRPEWCETKTTLRRALLAWCRRTEDPFIEKIEKE